MANAAKVHDKVKRARAGAAEALSRARAKADRKLAKIQAALAEKEASIAAALEETVTRAEAKLKRAGRSKKTTAVSARERSPNRRVRTGGEKKR